MTFYATYLMEFSRVIAAIILEGRQSFIQTKNKTGFQVKEIFDAEAARVVAGVIPYKIQTVDGNLAAYFSVITTGTSAQSYQLLIRPSFAQFSDQISQFISNFISDGSWIPDILQGEVLS